MNIDIFNGKFILVKTTFYQINNAQNGADESMEVKRIIKMKNEKGFTLIELIIVILVLGILAVTAAPKFLDMNKDARVASLKGLEGALKSTSELANIACRMTEGCLNASWGQVIFVRSLNTNVQILRGWPDAGEIARTDQIDDLIDYDGFVLSSEESNHTARWSVEDTTDCYVQYRQPDDTDGAKPTITIEDDGC